MIIDPSAPEPLYMQVARALRQQIISGQVPLGGLMPSEIQLRDEHGINRWVSRQAYGLLEKEGLVVSRRGIGRSVAAVPRQLVIELSAGDEVRTRMPAEDERGALGIGHGIPVLVITRADGREEPYSGSAAVARCGIPGGSRMPALT